MNESFFCFAMAGVLESVREEDYVKYFLFPREVDDINANQDTEELLNEIRLKVHSVVANHTRNYIWHKDGFEVHPRTTIIPSEDFESEPTGPLPPHLFGITYFGDNIEDEWFIVYLLLQLSKEVNGLVIRVIDSDGEFLLIEAAEHLPNWAKPETCIQRVYLYNGNIHIIPIHSGTNKGINCLAVSDALKQIRMKPQLSEAGKPIQNDIQERIKGYPQKIAQLLHRTSAYIPVGVAALLEKKPNLIAPAVLAFCNRDPIDMKACRAMCYFPPENRVMASVVFTKCLYAMITHHKFKPDRRTGWNMPTPNSENFNAYNLGVKLACGFEILVAQAKPVVNLQSPGERDISNERTWLQYLSSLKRRGYFQDFLEGSKDYSTLFEKAKDYYINHRDSIHCELSIGEEVLSLLENLEYDVEELRKKQSTLPPPDDDLWLEVCPEDLDTMLEQRYGKRPAVTANSSTDPANVSSQLVKFLDHISDLEGAEYPSRNDESASDSTPPIRPKRGIKKLRRRRDELEETVDTSVQLDEDETTTAPGKINFDPESFSCAVQNILDFVIPEDSWDLESDGSGMSSYEDEMDMDLDQLKKGKRKKNAEPESELKQYMDQMDQELADTTLGQSFEKVRTSKLKDTCTIQDDSFDDIENFQPVDIDMNALKNILESYQAQMGGAGPASNLLGPMGVKLEPGPSSSEMNET